MSCGSDHEAGYIKTTCRNGYPDVKLFDCNDNFVQLLHKEALVACDGTSITKSNIHTEFDCPKNAPQIGLTSEARQCVTKTSNAMSMLDICPTPSAAGQHGTHGNAPHETHSPRATPAGLCPQSLASPSFASPSFASPSSASPSLPSPSLPPQSLAPPTAPFSCQPESLPNPASAPRSAAPGGMASGGASGSASTGGCPPCQAREEICAIM